MKIFIKKKIHFFSILAKDSRLQSKKENFVTIKIRIEIPLVFRHKIIPIKSDSFNAQIWLNQRLLIMKMAYSTKYNAKQMAVYAI